MAMVKKGVAHIKSQGADKAYAEFADKEDIKGMTKKINGGLIGYEARQALYDACVAVCRA